MYTSFYAGSTGAMSQRSRHHRKGQTIEPPTATELREGGFDRQSVLHLNQRIMNGKIVVKKIITDTSFVIYHEDFRQEFLLKQIPENETIDKWVDLQTHSNLVTAFDSFIEDESKQRFQMLELNNGGNMYTHIESLNLDLAMEVPRTYLELIYDVGIQLATGLDFAHNAGLVHGQFDLSKVQIQNNGDNLEFKITDFQPTSSIDMPLSSEANYWPFAKNKKDITQREKMEVLMLKDVYSLGICLLEMMIGRFSKKKFSISLDSLPLTWAEFPESTPLIQVLVECIQIDSITNRKGKLQHIRKLLISEYKKYFKRAFYKMENPFVGKKADVYNKKGIICMFHKKGDEKDALVFWQGAEQTNDRHFDSKCNFVMYRWSTAKITDAVMMAELSEFVFSTPNKGTCLEAFLLIATGEKDQGVQILKQYCEDTAKEIKKMRIPNQKMIKYQKTAENVLSQSQLDKDTFIQNGKAKHTYTDRITHIAFSQGGSFLITTSKLEVKVWKKNQQLIGISCTILAEDQKSDDQVPMSCISKDGNKVVVHRGKLIFTVYNVDDEKSDKHDTIDLQKEIKACGNPGFVLSTGDHVSDLRFLDPEATVLRVYFTKAKEHYFIDVQMSDNVPKMRKAKAFEDRSAFTLQAGQVSNHLLLQNTLRALIDDEGRHGNAIAFPDDDTNTVVVLKREDPQEKYILIFDLKRNSYIRKIQKKSMQDEAFAIDNTGRILAYVDGEDLFLRLVRLPNNSALIDCLRPRYAVAEKKLNPAQASETKQSFKDKIYRDLHTYHMFKADQLKAEKTSGLTEEQNMHLMVRKYDDAVMVNHHKLKSNKEFQMMQKIIFRDSQKTQDITGNDVLQKCPIDGVIGTKRIEVYDDELTYISQNSKISMVQIASEPSRHFFLIAMDGIVFKYDLVSKALLFQFKTQATHAMILYDKDDKLLVANDKMIRLWDFYDHKEEAPELITSCESTLKVEKVFLNKSSGKSSIQGGLFVLVTHQNQYVLYQGRMEKVYEGEISDKYDNAAVTCCEFDKDSTVMWLGLANGKMICLSLKTGQEVGDVVNFSEEQGKPVTHLERFAGILDQNYFLVVVDNCHPQVWSQTRGDVKPVPYGPAGSAFEGQKICTGKVAFNGKFFALGIPGEKGECRALGFFEFDRQNFIIKPIQWVTKYTFKNFYMDDHLTSIMMLDLQSKTLDYQFVLWKFDLTQLNQKDLAKLDKGKMPGLDDDDVDSDVDIEKEKENLKKLQSQTSCCNVF